MLNNTESYVQVTWRRQRSFIRKLNSSCQLSGIEYTNIVSFQGYSVENEHRYRVRHLTCWRKTAKEARINSPY